MALPVLDSGDARERADAARNRRRILDAAARLVRERGMEHVSMDDVAASACVGTGTLYRRFGDRAGLAIALVDEHTRDFQDALIAGPPPLGPGAPPAERLRAFGEGYMDLLERHGDLLVAAGPEARGGERGPHAFYVIHLQILLREAAPQLDDHHYAAEALLASVAPAQYMFARHGLGWSVDRLRAGWAETVAALSSPRA